MGTANLSDFVQRALTLMTTPRSAYSRGFTTRSLVVALSILLVSVLHHVTPLSMLVWHNVLQHLYYLPIIFGAMSFGWRGGLAAAIFASLSHAPHVWNTWHVVPNYSEDQILESFMFCLAGVLTGLGAERERRQREALERTTKELSRVYRELQENFEQMKRAERLYAVGQLSAGLAHEIRNPLASIAGAAGILRRQALADARQSECVSIISRECERLNGLLKEFLDFARPRAPKHQPVDLGEVVTSVIDLASHATGERSIRLTRKVASGLPVLHTDCAQLTQALLNLLINAIQASPAKGEIEVSAAVEDRRAVIRVRDQGPGIEPENMDRIFDPFFTTKASGTGLGLSVAHQIVRQLGGLLIAHRNPDRGMTFSLQLPLGKGAAS